MYSYKIGVVAVLAFWLSLLLFKRLQIGSTHVLFVATTIRVSDNSVSVYSILLREWYLPAPYSCVVQYC